MLEGVVEYPVHDRRCCGSGLGRLSLMMAKPWGRSCLEIPKLVARPGGSGTRRWVCLWSLQNETRTISALGHAIDWYRWWILVVGALVGWV